MLTLSGSHQHDTHLPVPLCVSPVCLCPMCLCQGMRNPLDGVMQVTPHSTKAATDKAHKAVTGMYQYFLKVCVCVRARKGVLGVCLGACLQHTPAGRIGWLCATVSTVMETGCS